MLFVLTAEERKAALLIAGLLAVGALTDAWVGRIHAKAARAVPEPPAIASRPDRRMADSTAAGGARDVGPAAPLAGAEPAHRVDLNRATEQELDTLPGVGPVLARRILEHRRRYGPFRDPRDLGAVKGIGPRLLERLAPHVTVSRSAGGP